MPNCEANWSCAAAAAASVAFAASALWWCKSQTAGHHGEWVSLFAVQRARLSNRRRANIAPRSALHRFLNEHCAGREIRITMPMNILTCVHKHVSIMLYYTEHKEVRMLRMQVYIP